MPMGVDSAGGVLDELITEGARRMMAAALEAEVADYVDRYAEHVDEAARRVVVATGEPGSGRW